MRRSKPFRWCVGLVHGPWGPGCVPRHVALPPSPLLPVPLQFKSGTAAQQETRLAWGWLARLLQRTAEAAPGPTEANLSEQMRRAAAQPKGAAAEVMGRYMPEVLQVRGWGRGGGWRGLTCFGEDSCVPWQLAGPGSLPSCALDLSPCHPPTRPSRRSSARPQLVRSARARFPMAALSPQTYRGVMAWSTKLRYLGRVAGLAESAEAEDLPASSVPLECAKQLASVLRRRHTDRAVAER